MAETCKTILMIDRNFMVDRRIVLEAKALRKLGCSVALIAQRHPLNETQETEIDGLPIAWIGEGEDLLKNEFASGDLAHTIKVAQKNNALELEEKAKRKLERDQHASFLKRLAETDELRQRQLTERWIEDRIAAQRKIGPGAVDLSFFQLLKLGLEHPYFGLEHARKLEKRVARIGLSALFSLLTRDPEIYRRVIAKSGYAARALSGKLVNVTGLKFKGRPSPTAAAGKAISYDFLPQGLQDYFQNEPLDLWESKVLDFALRTSDLDVIHVHDLPALRVGFLISQRLGIPLVYDAHELYGYQPGILGEQQRMLIEKERRLIPFCDFVVVINDDQAKVMQKDYQFDRFVALTNATEQPPGFDITRRYSLIRDRISIPAEHKIMLFMGGINRARKIDQLLEGIAKGPQNVHMVFLTWGMEIPEFKALAADLNLADRVHFLDPVPWSDIVYWCASADVGVMPYQALDTNTRISSPNKMYEFIAAGTPMIGSSELVNVARVVPPYNFGILKPLRGADDYADLIKAIFDPSLGGPERFRPALIEHAHRFLWDKEVEPFLERYKTLFTELDAKHGATVQPN